MLWMIVLLLEIVLLLGVKIVGFIFFRDERLNSRKFSENFKKWYFWDKMFGPQYF